MAMKAKILPITGIGSLPHTSITKAVAFSKKFDIPFLPELSSLENSLNIQRIEDFMCFNKFIKSVQNEDIFKTQSFNDFGSIINERQVHFIDAPTKNFMPANERLGLHCCNSLELLDLKDLNVSHLSFDASLIEDPKQFIYSLLEKEITPVVGVVQTNESSPLICQNINQWRPLLREFITECWIAPACGLATYTEEQAEETLEILQALRRELTYSHL